MRLTLPFVVITSFMLLGQFSAAEEVFKWVDENGLTHYSALPPKNKKARIVKTQTGHSEPVSYKNSKPADESSSPAQESPVTTPAAPSNIPQKDPERCTAARKNLETLQNHARVRIKGDDGQLRYLTPNEHGQKMANAQKAIDESC